MSTGEHSISEIGPSLSAWICRRFQDLFGPEVAVQFEVTGVEVVRKTSFHNSEICVSASLCQCKKFDELVFLCHDVKNLRFE